MCDFAALAQLVEQFIRNEKVASSIPAIGTKVFASSIKPAPVTGTRVFWFVPLLDHAAVTTSRPVLRNSSI
jgi:hypothetical protein